MEIRGRGAMIGQLIPLAIGLIAGGFSARLGLELTGRPWPWPLVVAGGALSSIIGGGAAWHLNQRARSEAKERKMRRCWPMALLAIYLIWPQRQPLVAVWLLGLAGLTTLLTWLLHSRPLSRWTELRDPPSGGLEALGPRLPAWETVADISTFAAFLIVYIATTARDVLPADSGEFQIVAPLLGVAHPPGYPLYTFLGRLFIGVIPFGTAAYRLNLMSALLAAGTLTLLGAATRRWASHLGAPAEAALWGGLATALTLGTATTFWAQATVANIRMPTIFAAALGFHSLARYAEAHTRPQADRALGFLALALGLGVGHHPSLLFLGAFFLIYLIWVDTRLLVQPRRWWRPVFLASLAVLPLIYLPLRGAAGAPLAPPDLETVDGFVHHITAKGFEGDMFAFSSTQHLSQRLPLLPTLFLLQFNPVLLAVAALGLLSLGWRGRKLLTLLAGGLILHTFVSITYRAPQTIEYLMPAYLPVAILVGLTAARLLSPIAFRFSTKVKSDPALASAATVLAAAILLAGLANGLAHAPSFFTLARDRSTRVAMESILDQAPPDALILADWHWATSLWYLQWVEEQRPDVEVSYVFPIPGQEIDDTWKDRIEAVIGERPLLLTHFYDLAGYTLEPVGKGYWVHPRPYHADPLGLTPLDVVFQRAGDRVRVLGYHVNHLRPEPGQSIELTLAWQAVEELAVAPSLSAKVLTPDGHLLAQDDRNLGTSYAAGELRFERLVLPLYPNIMPGDYPLVLEVYNASEAGFEIWPLEEGQARLNLATTTIQPNQSMPTTLHPLDIPFTDGPTLVGVDYDRTIPGALRIYLHWQGPTHGGERINIGESIALLPPLPGSAFYTMVLDLPGDVQKPPHLTLSRMDGETELAAGPWGWPLRDVRLPPPSPTARFVPLGDQMALIGVSPDSGTSVASDGKLSLHLSFLALKPLVDDNKVSVRLLDEMGQWRQMHDLQPALGAIPTLKWIQGSRITDPHPLQVPQDITGRVVRASLVVYEGFRGTPLRPLDGRMTDVPLGEWLLPEH